VDIDLQLPSEKLGDRQLGPLDYRLDLPETLNLVFHVNKLYMWNGNEVNGLIPEELEPVYLEGEDEPEYEVEKLLDSQVRWRRMEYLVKWKGYDDSHNSWEPVTNLANAKQAITTFHQNLIIGDNDSKEGGNVIKMR
jgi:hypothetical protein